MTVSQLIERLREEDQDAVVMYVVNGDATRTGDYIRADDVNSVRVIDLTYGGADKSESDDFNREFTVGEPYKAIYLA